MHMKHSARPENCAFTFLYNFSSGIRFSQPAVAVSRCFLLSPPTCFALFFSPSPEGWWCQSVRLSLQLHWPFAFIHMQFDKFGTFSVLWKKNKTAAKLQDSVILSQRGAGPGRTDDLSPLIITSSQPLTKKNATYILLSEQNNDHILLLLIRSSIETSTRSHLES